MLKFAFSGKAGAGKNTVAEIVAKDLLKLNAEKYLISSFAKKIKQTIEFLLPGCEKEYLYGASELRQKPLNSELSKYIDLNVSARQLSLDLGKLGRSYNPLFWISFTAIEYNSLPELNLYSIADLRFVDEYHWLKSLDFILCRVKRQELIEIDDISEKDQDHLSDDMFDIVIENNGSFEELKLNIEQQFDKILANNSEYLQLRCQKQT